MLRWLSLFCWTPLLFAQADEIRTLLKNSEAAWNRGDLAAFASDYEDSPETAFIGREITRGGTQAILERYRRSYSNREAMGRLTFSVPIGDGGNPSPSGEERVREMAAQFAAMSGV